MAAVDRHLALGGAVEIVELHVRHRRKERVDEIGRQSLAARDYLLEAREQRRRLRRGLGTRRRRRIELGMLQECAQHRGDEDGGRHAVMVHQMVEVLDVLLAVGL